jgi:hypothetical protein
MIVQGEGQYNKLKRTLNDCIVPHDQIQNGVNKKTTVYESTIHVDIHIFNPKIRSL